MQVGNAEIVWPGWFWAIPTLCVLIVLPSVLLFVLFKYARMRLWKKALCVPACLLGPLLATSVWPLIISLTGVIRIGDSTGGRPADWRETAELFGDYGVYVWMAPTCLVVYAIYRRSGTIRNGSGALREGNRRGLRSPGDRQSESGPVTSRFDSAGDRRELTMHTQAVPEWLEEKATDAPTMVRVLVDVVDGKLQREHPRVRLSAEWHRFRQLGTIGGCMALALRLQADVPEAYRTPLEMAMRNALELSFPGSEALYEDCVRSVREALLEVERPKRGAATFVFISMWVFALSDPQGSLTSEPTIIAELAQIYQNESHNYWISTEVT